MAILTPHKEVARPGDKFGTPTAIGKEFQTRSVAGAHRGKRRSQKNLMQRIYSGWTAEDAISRPRAVNQFR